MSLIMHGHRQALIIYNPLAGTLKLDRPINDVAHFWRSHGWSVDVEATLYAGHARQLAQNAAETGYSLVIVAGGDGTLSEVTCGLVHSDTVMAPLPAGTGNSFAKELRLPQRRWIERGSLLAACTALLHGSVYRIDVGRSNDRYWLLWTGAGIDGSIIRRIEPRTPFSRRLGTFGFICRGLPALVDFANAESIVRIDGTEIRDSLMMVVVTNCRLYGGGRFLLNPDAVLDDGILDIWLFKSGGTLRAVNYLFQVARGRHIDSRHVQHLVGKDVEILCDPPVPIHHDGDRAGYTPIKCSVEPQALSILIPDTAPAGLLQSRADSRFYA